MSLPLIAEIGHFIHASAVTILKILRAWLFDPAFAIAPPPPGPSQYCALGYLILLLLLLAPGIVCSKI